MAYRIIIALDVEAKSAEEAYKRTHEQMKKVDTATFQWEGIADSNLSDAG